MVTAAASSTGVEGHHIDRQIVALYISTFLLRVGFAASLIFFDWILVWGIEIRLGHDAASQFGPIFLTSFASITFLIAEVLLTGYYGHRADRSGAKPVILWATGMAAIVILLYVPASHLLEAFKSAWESIVIMVLYLAVVHFLHGVVASGVVAPTLGFVNFNSNEHNRAYRMSLYDNAILYGRAVGMPFGGFLWYLLKVDEPGISIKEQANRIGLAFPILSIMLILATLLIVFGIENNEHHEEVSSFSLKEDITLAARVMFEPKRKPLLAPWVALAALIGSISLWGPSIAFRTSSQGNDRSIEALLPIIIIVVALALPAPFWGKYADSDRGGRKKTLRIGLYGLPVLGLGALVMYPFYQGHISLSNPFLLLGVVPGVMMISALVPVLMGALGDTAEKGIHDDGQVMSGYHFIIAMGEIVGILIGGLTIGTFALVEQATGWFGNQDNALLLGFLLFEVSLLLIVIIGIIKIPESTHPS